MASGNFAIKTRAEESYVGEFEGVLLSIRKMNRRLSSALSQINAMPSTGPSTLLSRRMMVKIIKTSASAASATIQKVVTTIVRRRSAVNPQDEPQIEQCTQPDQCFCRSGDSRKRADVLRRAGVVNPCPPRLHERLLPQHSAPEYWSGTQCPRSS